MPGKPGRRLDAGQRDTDRRLLAFRQQTSAFPRYSFDAFNSRLSASAHYDLVQHTQRCPRVGRLMPIEEWSAHYELVAAIESLKRKRNAVVLAHNYQRGVTLENVLDSLSGLTPTVEVPSDVAVGARRAVRRMLDLAEGPLS